MSETYTPAGNVGSSLQRATSGEAATGTHGDEFMRQNMSKIADKIRFLADSGIPTVSKIQFPSTQVADSDPNALDDYEEGTWTPTDGSGAGLTFTGAGATYEKIGRLVIARCTFAFPSTADATAVKIAGLPFTVANADEARQGFVSFTDEANLSRVVPVKNDTAVTFVGNTGLAITNVTMSLNFVYFTVIYRV